MVKPADFQADGFPVRGPVRFSPDNRTSLLRMQFGGSWPMRDRLYIQRRDSMFDNSATLSVPRRPSEARPTWDDFGERVHVHVSRDEAARIIRQMRKAVS